MIIPGCNLLNIASRVVGLQSVSYYQYESRSLNAIGQYVSTFADPFSIFGSFQAVPRNLYKIYGLDLQKNYYTFYTTDNIFDLQRDISGDQIEFNSKRYQCESSNEWFAMDGWKGILCILIN